MTGLSLPPSPLSLGTASKTERVDAAHSPFPDNDDGISTGLVPEVSSAETVPAVHGERKHLPPLFDPKVDTFDTMRRTAPFSLTVILAIVLRADTPSMSESRAKGERCLRKAQHFAIKSLFARSASLETVRGCCFSPRIRIVIGYTHYYMAIT
ncbi:hypothetical protein BJX63DRAFT_435560 [Aspergillus granulosus]|uniref:Uncharacterized protein n=1 Tax=Aspergillus granulosus TaxID=176169 RepID=A0ABR4H0W5_9EURO